MMKNKPKFDIKEFFIRHGEKIALVLIVPLALWIATWAMGYPPLSWKPDDLKKSADDAKNRIDSNDRTAADEEVSVFKYQLYAQQIKKPVETRYYRTPTFWNPSVFPELNPRSKPQVLPLHDLRARPGIGAIFVRPKTTVAGAAGFNLPGATGQAQPDKEGKRWIVVTGLIPIREQLNIYLEMFPSAKGFSPSRDWPMYAKYVVERCEVTPTGQSEWVELEVARRFKEEVINKWIAMTPELVDPAYLAPQVMSNFPAMAYPLPPLDKKKFGNEITQPSIPLLSESIKQDQSIIQQQLEKFRQQQMQFDPSKIDDFEPFQQQPGGAMGGDMRGGMGGGPGMIGMGGMPGSSDMMGMGQHEMFEEQSVKTTDYLFRFFDFDVEEGKSYRYRVRLELLNPNYKVSPGNLESPDLAKDKFLATDFSSESNSVTLGNDARVLAVSTVAPRPRLPWMEPTGTVMVVQFDMDSGNEWYFEKDRIYRGSVADFLKATVTSSILPVAAGIGMMDSSAPPPQPTGRGTSRPGRSTSRTTGRNAPAAPVATGVPSMTPETKVTDIHSGVCVLDMRGGYELPTARGGNDQLRSTGKMMLMEPNGTLVLHDMTEDFEEVYRYKNPTPDTHSFNPASGGMGMGMGMGYPDGM